VNNNGLNAINSNILTNNDPLPEALIVHSSQKTFNEIDSLQNHNIHISDESILNINETNDSSNIN